METKYDGYYQRDIPYIMNQEELQAYAKAHNGHMGEEQILAYIRFRGEDFRCKAFATPPENIVQTSMGIALASGGKEPLVLCKIVLRENGLYNPLLGEQETFHKDHWYNPYKIEYTPVDYKGCIEKMYFSDFCQHINQGGIILL